MNEKNYWAIHMGRQNKYANIAYENNFIAIGWNEIEEDLSSYNKLNKTEFFSSLEPIVKNAYKESTKNSSSAVIGQLFRFANLMKIGDVVLMPKTDENKVYVGMIIGDYFYIKNGDSRREFCRSRSRDGA